MRFRFIIICLFVAFPMAAQDAAEYRTKKYPNGNVRYEGWFIGDKPVKELKRYHENGKLWVDQVFDDSGNSSVKVYGGDGFLLATGRYVGSKRDGRWSYFTQSGNVLMVENYVDGRLEGECKVYDMEGNLLNLSFYKHDKPDSVRLQYYPNGNVMAKFFYRNGELEGEFRSYYYDGYPEYVGQYKAGKRDGWWYYTDDVGVTDSLFYENGVSDKMEDMIRMESDSSDSVNQYFADPEDYIDDPMKYISF